MWDMLFRHVKEFVFRDVCIIRRRVVLDTLGIKHAIAARMSGGVLLQICHYFQISYP